MNTSMCINDEIEIEQQEVAAEVAAAFDALMSDLEADHAHRVAEESDPDFRRMRNLIGDAAWGLIDELEFGDCPRCDGEQSYVRDDEGKQSICLECGYRYTDRAAANDTALADAIRDQLIADGKWPATPMRIRPAIAAARTSVRTWETEVA